MKKLHKNLIIAGTILMFVAASGTAYYKFVYKKEMKNKGTDAKGGKTNDNGGTTSDVSTKEPAKV